LGIVGANAVVAATEIDPDGGVTGPPINRSMVLRLIAGVRGL
jgi:hypothetical protein